MMKTRLNTFSLSRRPAQNPRNIKRQPMRRPNPAPRRPTGQQGKRSGIPGRSTLIIVAIVCGVFALMAVAFLAIRALTAGSTPTPSAIVPGPTPSADTTTPVAAMSAVISATPLPSSVPEPTAGLPSAGDLAAEPDIPALQQLALDLINQDRRANGLSEVAWDSTAAMVGLWHAQEMALFGYLSHWNLEGYGPDYRYSLGGGLDAVRENVYMYTHSSGGGPSSSEGWQRLIRQAQQSLMDSPMHRENILAQEHTHVGVGIAYEPTSGYLAISQEFTDRYLTVDPLPHRLSLGDTIVIKGRLGSGIASALLNLAYEPLPKPMTIEDLNATNAYSSPAQIIATADVQVQKDGSFQYSLVLNSENGPGLYHLRIWVDTAYGQVLASDIVIDAR